MTANSVSKNTSSETTPFRSGFVALVGRPSVGKSTLLNACMGQKVAIASPVAQTTRRRFRAVVNGENSQLVIVDTPGLHKPKDALGKELNKAALGELNDADVIAFLINHVEQAHAAFKLLIITKADIATPEQVAEQLKAAQALVHFDDVLVVSALEDFNVQAFIVLVSEHLPEGPMWFPEDMETDALPEDLVAEFVREKLLLNLRQEVPHSVAVVCDSYEIATDGHLSISATILVEREGQKGIVVGQGGSMIKRVGVEARKDLEKLFGRKVYLDLQVRVQPLWRRDANEIKRLGYSTED